MKRKLEIVIEKPRTPVAALYADRPRIEEWLPGVKYEHLSGEPGQPGAKAKLVVKRFTILEKVTCRNLPDSFSHIDKLMKWNRAIVENTFEELSPSSTKWTLQAELRFIIRPPGGKLDKIESAYTEPFKKFAEAEL